MTPLRSIPPANSSSKIPLAGHSARTPRRPAPAVRAKRTAHPFIPNVIPPDKAYLARRQSLRQALAANRRFWKDELTMWQEEFGNNYVAKLKERLGI